MISQLGLLSYVNRPQAAPLHDAVEQRIPVPSVFPEKLFRLFTSQEVQGVSMQWNAKGTTFCIFPEAFTKNVLNEHFEGTKFESFTRKMNRWGFTRVMDNYFPRSAIVYHHEYFKRDRPDLLKHLKTCKTSTPMSHHEKKHKFGHGMATPSVPFKRTDMMLPSSGALRAGPGALRAGLVHGQGRNTQDLLAEALQVSSGVKSGAVPAAGSPSLALKVQIQLRQQFLLDKIRENICSRAAMELDMQQKQCGIFGLQDPHFSAAPAPAQMDFLASLNPRLSPASPPASMAANLSAFGMPTSPSMTPQLPSLAVNNIMNGHNQFSSAAGSTEDEDDVRFRPYQEGQWASRLDDLREFAKTNGHCRVPNNYAKDPQLARWVKRQRYQYKLWNAGEPSTMTTDRVKILEAENFVWDSQSASWDERLHELKDFKRVYQHCNVPSGFRPNRRLARWVKCQRRQYKLFRSGLPSNMNAQRVHDLESIGFEWLVRVPMAPTQHNM